MSVKISRRALARYAAQALIDGVSAKSLAGRLATPLCESGYKNEIELLIGDVNWELERLGALSVGQVTSATPLTKHSLAELKNQLKKITDVNEVMLEEKLDKTVIGGLRIQTPSRIWDETVAGKLAELKEVF